MKSAIFAASLLVSAAVAHQHQHAAHHQKRQDDVVWVTDIDYVTEIVDSTTTYWVTSGAQLTSSPSRTPTHPHAKPSPSSESAPQLFQGSATVTSTVAPVVETSAAPAPPAPVETSAAPAPSPPAQSSSPSPAPEPTTSATPTTSAAPAPAPVSSTPPSTGGGGGGECSEGSPCSGDITYYDTGLGACGITSTDTQNVVALPHAFMGEQSNGNPYCGRTIAIKCESTGKTSTATVVDKCMGCDGYSIDLSPAVFNDLASESVGRTQASWYFTD